MNNDAAAQLLAVLEKTISPGKYHIDILAEVFVECDAMFLFFLSKLQTKLN